MCLRWTPCLLSAFFTLGCADMLGLGGLTYEQGAEQNGTGGAPDASGGLPPNIGDGDGDPPYGGSNSMGEEFSLLLDRSAVLTASPLPAEFPSYFFVEPGSGTISHRRQDGETSSLEGTWDWPSPQGLSHLAVVPYEEGWSLISYNQISGSTSHATLDNSGEFVIVSTGIETSGRTEFTCFFSGAAWYVFVYSASDGNYRYFRPLPSDEAELFAGVSEPGWTSIERFTVGTDVGLLKHNNATRVLQFDRFVAAGQPFEAAFEVPLSESFSHMVTFGETGILLYQGGTGTTVVGTIVEDAAGAHFRETERGYFRGDLSRIVPLAGTRAAQALTFSEASGQVVLHDLAPLESLRVGVQ